MTKFRKKNLGENNINKDNVIFRNRNMNTIRTIARSKVEDLHIKFTHFDGSTRSMDMNDSFIKNEKNQTLNPLQITRKLNTLKHDFGAKYYEVINLSI